MLNDCTENRHWLRRLKEFILKPTNHKLLVLAMYWRRVFTNMPVPIRLSSGAWWIARQSALDSSLLGGTFECGELRFVERYLLPGMTVLDIGAHHGLYTLLAAKRVGRTGRVIAFEPSPRERDRLLEHTRLNLLSNVAVESLAIGPGRFEAKLYQVAGAEDYCNSLRPPADKQIKRDLPVQVISLDEYLSERAITRVDFLKIDTEGAELGILKGATRLLESPARPVFLCEVAQIRTIAWGYSAIEIIEFMTRHQYLWFGVRPDGCLLKFREGSDLQNTNLVAVPAEKASDVLRQVNGTDGV